MKTSLTSVPAIVAHLGLQIDETYRGLDHIRAKDNPDKWDRRERTRLLHELTVFRNMRDMLVCPTANSSAEPCIITTSKGDCGYIGRRILARARSLELALECVHLSGWDDAPDVEIYQRIS